MKNEPRRAVVCYSKSEIYARLAWILQPARYKKLGPVALIAIQTDESPWPQAADADSARFASISGSADPFRDEAVALRTAGSDPMVTLLDETLRSVGQDRDLIFSLAGNIHGVLRAPVTRPAEPEAFAHLLLSSLTERTSIPLWGGVAVSSLGDTPGLLLTHCTHAVAQAWQLGSGQLAVFDEVDRTVVRMQQAEASSGPSPSESTANHQVNSSRGSSASTTLSADTDPEDEDPEPVSLIDTSKLPINNASRQKH